MLIVLTISIVLLIVFNLRLYNNDFFSPSLLCCYMFCFSSIAAIVGNLDWKQKIDVLTVVYIVAFLMFICLGELLSRKLYFCFKHPKINSLNVNKPVEIRISVFVQVLLVGLALYTFYKYFNMVLSFSISHGNPFGIPYMLKYYRLGVREGYSLNMSFFMKQSIQLSKFLSYFFFYIFVNNILYFKKHNVLLICYVLIAIGMNSLTSSRGGLINLIGAYLIIYLCSYMKKHNWEFKHISFRLLFIMLVSVFVFFFLFSFLGNFTGKTSQAGGAFQQIINYVGGPIVSFNDFVVNYGFKMPDHGLESVSGFREILSYFGFSFNNNIVDLDFFVTGDLSTNVYTILRRYIHDYSVFGCMLLGLFIGFFYGELYHCVKRDNSFYSIKLIAYSYLSFPIFYISFDDMFLRGIFSGGTIYMILYFSVLWFLLRRKVVYSEARICE